MTVDEFIALRKRIGWTQSELARHFDMSTRALQDIENGRAKLRLVYVLAIERLAIRLATNGDASLMPDTVRAEVEAAARNLFRT